MILQIAFIMINIRKYITPIFLISYILYFIYRRFFENNYLLIAIVFLFLINTISIIYSLFYNNLERKKREKEILIFQLIANMGFLFLIYFTSK